MRLLCGDYAEGQGDLYLAKTWKIALIFRKVTLICVQPIIW